MNSLPLWKFILTQIPALFSFLCEFPGKGEDSEKKSFSLPRLMLIAIGVGLWYFVFNSVNLGEQASKDKAKIAELTQTVNMLSMSVNQEKSAKERKEDRIDLLKAQLRESESDLTRYINENERLREEIASLKTKLTLCQGRPNVCSVYRPSVELFDAIESEEGDR